MTLRLRGSKTELEEMGEDVTDMATTTSQLQAKLLALTGGKVDIMLDANTFKNSTQILREMADAWKDMNDIQRASALELMGGKRQANVLSALIQNFDTVEDVIKTSTNSAGSALRENEKYLDSIQGKIDQFNNAMQSMWSDTLDSDAVKFFVELATQLVKIVDAVGPLNIALVGFFTYLGKQTGIFDNLFKPAGDGLAELQKQLTKAEQDLAKATESDLQHGSEKTAQKRRDAEERVAILKARIQESSSEAVLDGIDESFDPNKVKKQISGKKGAITKRAKKLEDEGKSFAEIQEDPKIKQWTQEVQDGQQAIDEYNASVKRADATLRQSNATTAQATTTERAHAAAENADASATSESVSAEIADTTATETHTAATWADVWAEMTRTGATGASVAATIKQVIATKLANSALVQKGLAIMGVTAAEGASIPVTTMLAGGFVGLAASIWSAITAMWTFMTTTPIGWILLAVAAVVALGAAFAAIHKSSAELREELSGLKSEISSIKDEIDSLNSELETTQERMAELLAQDSLTFTEQEELEKLQKQNDLLEREIYLLEQKEKRLQAQAQNTFDDLMKKSLANTKRDLDGDGEKDDVFDRSLERRMSQYKNRIDAYNNAKDELVQAEKELEAARESGDVYAISLAESKVKQKENKVKRKEKRRDKKKAQIDNEIAQYLTDAEGIDYESADTQTKAYLDYINNTVGKLAIIEGDDQAKSNEIKRIFNKDALSGAKAEIEDLVKQLAKDPSNESIITQISEQCELAKNDLAAVGLSVEDAKKYFTQLGSMASFDTLEGKMAEVARAATDFEALLGGKKFNVDGVEVGLADLFNKEGKVVQTTLSQIFRNTSAQTRQDITKLLEGSYDQIQSGTVDTQKLLNGFGLKAAQQVIGIQNKLLGEQNLELFPNLKDEIDGIIDKFDELSKAIGSVESAMETLEKARAEEAYSGSISIETLENLMQYTDDYAQLVEVDETGAIRLVTNAEEMLTKQRVEKIKADAQAAVQTAQLNLEQAKYNERAANETHPIQNALTKATDWLSGSFAYLGSLIGDVAAGNFSGMLERASSAYNSKIAAREESRAVATLSVEDAQKALDNALLQQQVADAWANGTMQYSSEDASGGNDTKEDAEKDLIEQGWEALINKYENQLALITNERDLIEAEIDKAEARGGKASAEYYEDLIRTSTEEKTLLEEQYTALSNYLEANKDTIDQNTWTEYNNTLNDVAVAIKECETNTISWQEALREIDIHYFEEATDEISRLGKELELVDSLLEDEDVTDENGNWSSAAITRMAMYTNMIEKAATDTQRYQDEIAKLEEQYKGGELSEEQYQDRLATLTDGLYDSIDAQNDARDSIVELNEARIDAIKEGIEKEIEAYEDLIDAKKEELDAERDLYDFRKNIKKQTKDISELERRIASLSGSSAASDVAERRRLEAQLMEAKEGLNDTYYDHSRDAQSSALDGESEAYRKSQEKRIEKLEETLDNVELLIQNSMMDVLFNADVVYNELNGIADTYGITLSDELTQPWKDASTQAIAWKDELKLSMTSGEYAALIGEGGAITVFASGVGEKLSGSWNTAKTAVERYSNFLTGTELGNKFSSTITGFANQIQKIIDKWNGVKTAADNAYQAQLRVQNVGGNSNAGSGDNVGIGVGSAVATAVKQATAPAQVDSRILSKYKLTAAQVSALGYGPISLEKFEELLRNYQIKYSAKYKQVANTQILERALRKVLSGEYVTGPMAVGQYAKGTTGTPRDEWAITDEPQFGDELVLVPGKDGNLSFMRKGTGVVPADMTQKLFELAQIPTSDLMNKNLTAIVPNITKNDFKNEFNFESLVHVDTVDSDTLPKLEKMVDKKIDDFSKALNYSLKRFAR